MKGRHTSASRSGRSKHGIRTLLEMKWISAQSSKLTATNAQLLQLVSFTVAAEEYGLDILRVQEIIRTQQLTRVPNLPDYVEGVINLRGKVIPVVALRRRLGLETIASDKNTRIVVVDIHGQTLGFIVDAVSEVLASVLKPWNQLRASALSSASTSPASVNWTPASSLCSTLNG